MDGWLDTILVLLLGWFWSLGLMWKPWNENQCGLKRRSRTPLKGESRLVASRPPTALHRGYNQHNTTQSCASRPALCYRFSHSIILHPPQCLYSKPIYLGGWLMALHDHKWILSFLPIGHLCHHRQPGLKWDEGVPLLFYHQRWSEPSRSICFPTGLTL